MASQPRHEVSPSRPSSDDNIVELGDGKVKVPLPTWAKTTIAVLTVMASVSTTLVPVLNGIHGKENRQFVAAHKVRDDTLTKFLSVQTQEAANHRLELPNKVDDLPITDGAEKLELRHYNSDGCIQALRKTPDGVITSSVWVPRFDPSELTPSPGLTGDVQQVGSSKAGSSKPLSTPNPGSPSRSLPVVAVNEPVRLHLAAFSITESDEPDLRPVLACQGHCTDPHPGQPTTAYGQTKGCWAQVVRTWGDGCSQYQWYDTCHSIWDPKIYWTCCND